MNAQTDDPIILSDWSNRRGPNPFGASFQCPIEQDLIESAAHDAPGLIRNLDIFSVSTLDRNPKRVFAIRPVKGNTMFDWVPLSVQRVAQPEFSQSHSRGPRHRLTDVIARKNIPLDDDRTDSASKQIHCRDSSSRSTAYDNDRVLFLRHFGETFLPKVFTNYQQQK